MKAGTDQTDSLPRPVIAEGVLGVSVIAAEPDARANDEGLAPEFSQEKGRQAVAESQWAPE